MYHTIIIVGNLGRDPEMRYTPSGQAVTNFNVATNRQYTASDGSQVKETIWFRVSSWGKQAETCNQFLKKGSKVLVEGVWCLIQQPVDPESIPALMEPPPLILKSVPARSAFYQAGVKRKVELHWEKELAVNKTISHSKSV